MFVGKWDVPHDFVFFLQMQLLAVEDAAVVVVEVAADFLMPSPEREDAGEVVAVVVVVDSSTPLLGQKDAVVAAEAVTMVAVEASWQRLLLEAAAVAVAAATVVVEASWQRLLQEAVVANCVRAQHMCCCTIFVSNRLIISEPL